MAKPLPALAHGNLYGTPGGFHRREIFPGDYLAGTDADVAFSSLDRGTGESCPYPKIDPG